MNSDISKAAELYACSWLSSIENVTSQDGIKKQEVRKKPTLKDGAESLQFMGDRVAKVALSFERD